MTRGIPQDAFAYFFGLGSERSYAAVAEHYGVSKQAVAKWATKEGWSRRVGELEAKARTSLDQKLAETVEAMNDRHIQTLRVIQAKALAALKSMQLDTAMNAVRALDLCIKQERVIRGEPADRTAVDVEGVIKREYERWLVRDDEEVHDGHGRG